MEGEDGLGVGWSVGAVDVGAEGPREFDWPGVDASSTSFNKDDRKLGSLRPSPMGRGPGFAAREGAPV